MPPRNAKTTKDPGPTPAHGSEVPITYRFRRMLRRSSRNQIGERLEMTPGLFETNHLDRAVRRTSTRARIQRPQAFFFPLFLATHRAVFMSARAQTKAARPDENDAIFEISARLRLIWEAFGRTNVDRAHQTF